MGTSKSGTLGGSELTSTEPEQTKRRADSGDERNRRVLMETRKGRARREQKQAWHATAQLGCWCGCEQAMLTQSRIGTVLTIRRWSLNL
jgi:hypothetical protein